MDDEKKRKKTARSDLGRARQKADDPRTHSGVRFTAAIRLRALREQRGLTQAHAAAAMGVPASTLIRNELGLGLAASKSVLAAASAFYSVDPNWLEYGDGETPQGLPAVAAVRDPESAKFKVPEDGLLHLKNVSDSREAVPFSAKLLAQLGITNLEHLGVFSDDSGVHIIDALDLSPGFFVFFSHLSGSLEAGELERHKTAYGEGLYHVQRRVGGLTSRTAVRPADIRGRVVLTLAPPQKPPPPPAT